MPRLNVDPEIATALKVTADDLAAMTLSEFCDLCYFNGFDVRCLGFSPTQPGTGNLTLRVARDAEQRPILNMSAIGGAA